VRAAYGSRLRVPAVFPGFLFRYLPRRRIAVTFRGPFHAASATADHAVTAAADRVPAAAEGAPAAAEAAPAAAEAVPAVADEG
jgi:hypothetical protein